MASTDIKKSISGPRPKKVVHHGGNLKATELFMERLIMSVNGLRRAMTNYIHRS